MGLPSQVTDHKYHFNTFSLLFAELRPKQWTKNLLVLAAPLFSMNIINSSLLAQSVAGFFVFCIISSCVYILNDFVDREADKNHPEKKNRPMASGALNPFVALGFGAVLLVTATAYAFYINWLFGTVVSIYFAMNVAYSFWLKQVVIIDVMIIAAGFVLRAIGGGLVIGVPFTPWFLICILWLALFLAISKRHHEVYLLQSDRGSHRAVLKKYSPQLLNQITSIVTTATIMSYSLFTFSSGRTIHLMWTIPLVIYGVFRYLYLIHVEEKGGRPEKILLEDKHILITVLLYAVTVFIVLYHF